MGLLSKVKSMFIYDDEEEEKDEIKKEVIQVKIPTPERKKEEIKEQEEIEEIVEHDVIKEKIEVRENSIVEKKEEEVSRFSPKYFDDSDFEMPGERIVEPELVKQEYKYTRTETIIKPTTSGAYSGIKKESSRNVFTPTPIISPVYGILDKNYKKEEIATKKRPTKIYSQFDKIDVDDIRNKAFGNFDDDLDLDLQLRERDTIIFNDDIDVKIESDVEITEYEEQPLDIFKEMEKKDALDALLDSYNIDDSYQEEVEKEIEETKTLVEEELSRDYDNYEKELQESYKEDLNDSDLFNLIDSMYNNGDGE